MFNLYQKITDKKVAADIGYIEKEALYYKNNDEIDGLKKIPTEIYNARYHDLNLLENGFCLLADDSGVYSLKNEDDVFSYFEALKKIIMSSEKAIVQILSPPFMITGAVI